MIRQWSPKLRQMAWKMVRDGAQAAVEVDDLVSVALVAVLAARKRYDPERGTSFKTFVMRRAYGAMIDELRELDHVPRQARRLAKASGIDLPKVQSIDNPTLEDQPRQMVDRRILGPVCSAIAVDLWHRVRQVVGPRGAEVLERYYRRDYTLKEIGRQLGLSESRVCQLHGMAVQRLQWKGKEGIA